VGSLLGQHELGLYKQPMAVVTSMFAVITSATTPVLFSTLSRLQFEPVAFKSFFLKFQFAIAAVVLPLGVGSFIFRDFLIGVLFGPQWNEAALMFGAWSLSTAFMIVLSHYCSEVYRSLGRPRISTVAQLLYLSAMVPLLFYAASDGFHALVVVNAAVRSIAIVINQVFIYVVAGITFFRVIINIYPQLVASALMGVGGWVWNANSELSVAKSMVGIAICCVLYLATFCLFARGRENLTSVLRQLRGVRKHSA